MAAIDEEQKTGDSHGASPAARRVALILLFVAPALFASNMLIARATHDVIPPVALAFWRWSVTLLLLLPLTAATLLRARAAIAREWPDLLILGGLGMGVCGAFVYIGADTTTATNIGLIYAASPILIVIMARLFYGEILRPIQMLGVALSLMGVIVVVCRGELAVLLGLRFTVGDLWIIAAMVAWALYSILLRHRPSSLSLMARFAAITAGGVIVLLPFTLAEAWSGELPRLDATTVGAVLFVAVVPSLGAYLAYARIQSVLGAGPAGLLMYLIPLYNGLLAYVILGERLQSYHLAGALLVLPGVFLATRRSSQR